MRYLCRIVTILYGLLYLGALSVLALGTFGWQGQPRDPLSGVFLVPLGLPWNGFVDLAPERYGPAVAAMAPLVNLFLLATLCGLAERWRRARARRRFSR